MTTATRKPATRGRYRRSTTKAETPEFEIKLTDLLTEALTVPGSVGDTYSRFYEYSFMNCIVLRMQGVREPVASYKIWKALGRQVRGGEKGKWINRPIMVKRAELDESGQPTYFRKYKYVRGAFGYSQTDGPELASPEIPGWDLQLALAALDIAEVTYDSLDGNCAGYSRGRQYAINPVATHPTKTRFHELAHVLLGHTTDEGLEQYRAHRGVWEFQAEAVAYLALKELGFDGGDDTVSRGYIQGWLGEHQPSDAEIKSIFKVVNELLKAGRPASRGATVGESS